MGEQAFPLVDQYMRTRMDVDFTDLEPRRIQVVESERRVRREQSYGFLHALWLIWLEDGRSAVSVPPGAGAGVEEALARVDSHEQVLDPHVIDGLKGPVNASLARFGLEGVDRVLSDLCFACNAALLRRHHHGDCRQFTNESLPCAEGIALPKHCFPDGIVYGVVADGGVASFAFAHRSGVLEGRVADLGVETAFAYRRRGFAKTAVSAVVGHVTRDGGEARYGCNPDNHASIATARSVGFAPYGFGLILSAPAPDLAMQ